MNLRLVLTVVSAALALGCLGSGEMPPPRPATKVVMFVDLTQSIAQVSAIEGFANIAQKVVTDLPDDAHLFVYPIDRSRTATALYEFETTRAKKPSEVKLRQAERVAAGEELKRAILERRKMYETGVAQKEPISCILRTLATASAVLQAACVPGPSTRCWLVYLSDMIEDCDDLRDCGDQSCGRMALTKDLYKSSRQMLENYAPKFSLADARVVVITAAESPSANDKKAAFEDVQSFWKTAFGKAGVPLDRDLWFLSSLPPNFLR